MASAPCFITGVAPTCGGRLLVTQPTPDRWSDYAGAAVGVPTGLATASSQQSWANGVGIFSVVLGVCGGASRRRSRRTGNYGRGHIQCLRAATLTVDDTTGVDADKFDYVLQGTSEITKSIGANKSDDPAASLTAYMQRPVTSLTSLELPAGISMLSQGGKKAATGSEEQYFELKLPTIEFPGIFSVNASSFTFVKGSPTEVIMESNEFRLTGGIEDFEEVNKTLKCFNKTEFTWVDDPEKREIKATTTVIIKMDPPEKYRGLLPKDLFNTVGDGAMKLVLGVVQNGLADAFAKDYERWEMDEARK